MTTCNVVCRPRGHFDGDIQKVFFVILVRSRHPVNRLGCERVPGKRKYLLWPQPENVVHFVVVILTMVLGSFPRRDIVTKKIIESDTYLTPLKYPNTSPTLIKSLTANTPSPAPSMVEGRTSRLRASNRSLAVGVFDNLQI